MLTKFQTRKLTRLFNIDDDEKRGYVDRGNYVQLANRFAAKLNWHIDSKEYQDLYSKWMMFWDVMIKHGDTNRDNHLNLEEFLKGFDYIINKMENGYNEVLKHVPYLLFKIHDTNKDGILTLKEYEEFMNLIHSGLSKEKIKEVFMKTAIDSDKVITKDEFDKIVYQFFYSENVDDPGNYLFGAF